jgi:hypothetical protein
MQTPGDSPAGTPEPGHDRSEGAVTGLRVVLAAADVLLREGLTHIETPGRLAAAQAIICN